MLKENILPDSALVCLAKAIPIYDGKGKTAPLIRHIY